MMEAKEPEHPGRHTAYHEAGHVIADLVFGYRFAYVTIRPDKSGEYEGVVYGSTRGRARNLAVILLAGIVASAKMAGYEPWESPPRFDDDRADLAAAGSFIGNWAAFVSRTYGESSVREQIRGEAEQKTRQLVEENRVPIEVVAEALLLKETLSYEDVIGILKDRCPDFLPGKGLR
jgi:hypothetical protein